MNPGLGKYSLNDKVDHMEKLNELKSIAKQTNNKLQQLHSKNLLSSLSSDHFEFLVTELRDGRFDAARLKLVKRVQWHMKDAYQKHVVERGIESNASNDDIKPREGKSVLKNERIIDKKATDSLKSKIPKIGSHTVSAVSAPYTYSRNKEYRRQNALKNEKLQTVSNTIKGKSNTDSSSFITAHVNIDRKLDNVNKRRIAVRSNQPVSNRYLSQEYKESYSASTGKSPQILSSSTPEKIIRPLLQKVHNPSVSIVPLVKQSQPSISLPPKRNFSEGPANQGLFKFKHFQDEKNPQGLKIRGGTAYENLLHVLKEKFVQSLIEKENIPTRPTEASEELYKEEQIHEGTSRLRNKEDVQIFNSNGKKLYSRKAMMNRIDGSLNVDPESPRHIFIQSSDVGASHYADTKRDRLSIPTSVPQLLTDALNNNEPEGNPFSQKPESDRGAFFRGVSVNFDINTNTNNSKDASTETPVALSEKPQDENVLFEYSSFSSEVDNGTLSRADTSLKERNKPEKPEQDREGVEKSERKEDSVKLVEISIENRKESDALERESVRREDGSTESYVEDRESLDERNPEEEDSDVQEVGESERTNDRISETDKEDEKNVEVSVSRDESDLEEVEGSETRTEKKKTSKEANLHSKSEIKNVEEFGNQNNAQTSTLEYSSDVEFDESMTSNQNSSERLVDLVNNREKKSIHSETPSLSTEDNSLQLQRSLLDSEALELPKQISRHPRNPPKSTSLSLNDVASAASPLKEMNDPVSKSATNASILIEDENSGNVQPIVYSDTVVHAEQSKSSQSSNTSGMVNTSDSISAGEIVFPSIEIGDVTISEGEIEFEASISHMEPCNHIAIRFSTKDYGTMEDVSESPAISLVSEHPLCLRAELINKETQTSGAELSSQISSDLSFSEGILQPQSTAQELVQKVVSRKCNTQGISSISEGEIISNLARISLSEEERKLLEENEILRQRLSTFTGRFCVSSHKK